MDEGEASRSSRRRGRGLAAQAREEGEPRAPVPRDRGEAGAEEEGVVGWAHGRGGGAVEWRI